MSLKRPPYPLYVVVHCDGHWSWEPVGVGLIPKEQKCRPVIWDEVSDEVLFAQEG